MPEMINWPIAVHALFADAFQEPQQAEKKLKKHFRSLVKFDLPWTDDPQLTQRYRKDLATTLLGTLCFKRRLETLLRETFSDKNTSAPFSSNEGVRVEQDATLALACAYWWNVPKKSPPAGLLKLLPKIFHDDVKRAAQQKLPCSSIKELALAESHPDWLVTSWAKHFTRKELLLLLQTLNQKAPVWIHYYGDAQKASALFAKEKIRAQPHAAHPNAFFLEPFSQEQLNIWGSPLWQQGAFEVQDLGSQILTAALDNVKGCIADVCAGAGGKTLLLAADSKKQIFASDVSESALHNLRARHLRHLAGTHNALQNTQIKTRQGSPKVWQDHPPFDAVLVDAPCSSTGTLRRGPARRWCIPKEAPLQMALLQAEILDEAAPLVKQDGLLLYATCSLQIEENQSTAAAFLRRHDEFSAEPLQFPTKIASFLAKTKLFTEKNTQLTLWPHQSNTDGFFMALFRRH